MEIPKKTVEELQKWLKYAPEPPPLKEGEKWHVFLSYRSVNRAWVLNLYDSLRQAGFEVFVDQFVLVPGESLVTSLENALEQSASGIIVWSAYSKDSKWCKREYDSMVTFQGRTGSRFRFLIVKLDNEELPIFAANSLYEDFSDSIEGPRGPKLLRVLYGLVGKPPTEDAVRFAEKVDEEINTELTKIEGAKNIGDSERLFNLGISLSLPWLISPLLACKAAQSLIELDEVDNALDVLKHAEEIFPKSIRPKQLRALALARMGQWSAAQQILSELYAAGHRDPETLGIFARTWMDRYKTSQKLRHLEKSRNLYREAFELNPQDYYTGINAASKSLFLGELNVAKELAEKVEAIVGKVAVPGDYWKTATVGEVQLIQGNYEKAAKIYRDAVLIDPEATGSHTSTLGQAKQLMEKLRIPEEQRLVIEKAFE
jgi:tetratricopeptide (TPR) repeat protein